MVSTDGVGADGSVQAGQAQDALESDRGEAGRLDRLQVPAAALDVQDQLFVAENVAFANLD